VASSEVRTPNPQVARVDNRLPISGAPPPAQGSLGQFVQPLTQRAGLLATVHVARGFLLSCVERSESKRYAV